MNTRIQRLTTLGGLTLALAVLAGCERPPPESVQRGYRGLGMEQIYNPRQLAINVAANKVPPALAAVPEGGPPASTVFKNVQVLGNLGVGEFTRTMLAITEWVSPKQGCAYCHNTADMASDEVYTKVVARRMLQMTQHVNATWKTHVAETGVTCYTCHRGQPVPSQIWFTQSDSASPSGTGNRAGQNEPTAAINLASLPVDPFTPFLRDAQPIRAVSTTALPAGNRQSVKQTEWTYSLMIHMSQSLGVNCTYCHNSRSFAAWDSSTPQRGVAWYGIRMVRDLNVNYLEPLKDTFPPVRHGPLGDVAKLNCATCHQGVFKPLYGASMLKDYPVLASIDTTPIAPPPAEAPAMPEGPLGKVLFDTGKSAISAEGMTEIESAAKFLADHADFKVDLSGYTDKTGNAAKNLELAKQRAFAVRDALKAAGVSEERINLKKPEVVIGGASDESRRVDINPVN